MAKARVTKGQSQIVNRNDARLGAILVKANQVADALSRVDELLGGLLVG